MVAADMANLHPYAAQLEVEALAEHDLGEPDANVAGRRQLLFDVVGVLLGVLAGRDPAVERLVAPVGCRELLEVAGGELVRHDVCSELVRAENVIPVGVGEDDVGRLGHAFACKGVEELASVGRRRAGVQPDRGALTLDGAERRTVRRRRRQPVHVLADLLHATCLRRG